MRCFMTNLISFGSREFKKTIRSPQGAYYIMYIIAALVLSALMFNRRTGTRADAFFILLTVAVAVLTLYRLICLHKRVLIDIDGISIDGTLYRWADIDEIVFDTSRKGILPKFKQIEILIGDKITTLHPGVLENGDELEYILSEAAAAKGVNKNV